MIVYSYVNYTFKPLEGLKAYPKMFLNNPVEKDEEVIMNDHNI
ncbi:hypothetical protein ACFL4L_04420 [bacterium]